MILLISVLTGVPGEFSLAFASSSAVGYGCGASATGAASNETSNGLISFNS